MVRIRLSLLVLLLSLLLLFISSTARAQTWTGRAPWAPGPPDPCSGAAVPCAQINDFTLTARLAGGAAWPGAGYAWSSTGVVGVTASALKTLELGLSLPVTYVRGSLTGAWSAGPPEVRLRWRMGPRMGVPPFGGAWPAAEPFYKDVPADYDVRPARWTLTMGFDVKPLWPRVTGTGPWPCRNIGTENNAKDCLAEVSLSAAADLRTWRILWTGQLAAHVLGDGSSAWSAGGRAALDIAGAASLFSEALYRNNGAENNAKELLLVGAQLLPFRGARLSAWYGWARGGGEGAHQAGLQLDIPLGVHGYSLAALARLVAYVDPIVGGTGWLYDDECSPLYRLGSVQGDQVYDEWRKAWIPVGTHLWRRGGQLYFDKDGKVPYGPVRRSEGRPPPIEGVAEIPWPAVRDLERSTPEGRRWLAQWARSPLPERQRQCAALMDATQKELEAGARAATLGDACQEAREDQRLREQIAGRVGRRDLAGGVAIAGLVSEAVYCSGAADTSPVRRASQAAALLAAVVVQRVPMPRAGAAPRRALPPGPAPLPPARQLAGRPPQLALPPAAAAAPGPRAAPAPAAQAVPTSWLPAATPAASTASHAPPVAYHRPPNATTPRQRRSVQGKPCADCGKTAPVMVADHKTPLVVEHYTTGGIDRAKMHAVDAVQPQCPTCSAKQGAALRQYSAQRKKGPTTP